MYGAEKKVLKANPIANLKKRNEKYPVTKGVAIPATSTMMLEITMVGRRP